MVIWSHLWASQVVQLLKYPPANAADPRDTDLIPGWEDPPEEEMATPSSVLAWRIPWTEEPGGLWPTGLHRVRGDLTEHRTSHAFRVEKEV